MAYNKISNKLQDKDVNYLGKDFQSFKNKLQEFAEVYFPNTHNDFSENNPSTMFLEMAAYVGDVLSFYTDNQLREAFLNLAQERENIFNLAYSLGYRPTVTSAATANLEVFQLVPSRPSANYMPDLEYALTINRGSTFQSSNGTSFYTTKNLRFGVSSSFEGDQTSFNIYQYDSNNNPEYYTLKKTVQAISAVPKTQKIEIGPPEKFKTISLFDRKIISIESITDSDGNVWDEVPYLAQDTKFVEVENHASTDPDLHQYNAQTPYLLKLKKVSRRFVTRHKSNNQLEISFGAGISDKADEEIIPNPDNIGMGIKDGRSTLDLAYDPSNFLFTKAYGQVPSNTTLTIKYLTGGGIGCNVPSNTITQKGFLDIRNKPNLNLSLLNFCKASIGATNPEPARGGGTGDTLEEIRLNAIANFPTQQRTVTKEDYIVRTLSMPTQFGRVAKAYIQQDDQLNPVTGDVERIPNPLALNIHTLGYDGNKKLVPLNTATKTNLATYLEQYRMLTDAINIKDAFVINIALDFSITVFKNYNNQETLIECIAELQNYFKTEKWQINQPILISEVENLIGTVKGVQTVESVNFHNRAGIAVGYSQHSYDLVSATKNKIIYPSLDPSIFEIKFPNEDIQGSVTTY